MKLSYVPRQLRLEDFLQGNGVSYDELFIAQRMGVKKVEIVLAKGMVVLATIDESIVSGDDYNVGSRVHMAVRRGDVIVFDLGDQYTNYPCKYRLFSKAAARALVERLMDEIYDEKPA